MDKKIVHTYFDNDSNLVVEYEDGSVTTFSSNLDPSEIVSRDYDEEYDS